MKHPYLSEEHEIFRMSFRKFLEKKQFPTMNDGKKRGSFPRSFWVKMGETGFFYVRTLKKIMGVPG
ncbi:acyl-CoA dehydrogenase family protein [Peribacillus frigoritolerans]|nr:acyl-CoA dehydrogenase family protein [Peribacillus frigoritolerans]